MMKYKQYQKDLNKVLESEIFGEALFNTLAKHAKSADQQQKWHVLAELETQTLFRFKAFIRHNGLNASSRPHIKAQGVISGIALSKLPWSAVMYLIKDGTQPFMRTFERLCQNSNYETYDFFQYVLRHEQSIQHFATCELAKQSMTSLDQVLLLLD